MLMGRPILLAFVLWGMLNPIASGGSCVNLLIRGLTLHIEARRWAIFRNGPTTGAIMGASLCLIELGATSSIRTACDPLMCINWMRPAFP